MNALKTQQEYFLKLKDPQVLGSISTVELALILLALYNVPEAKEVCDVISKRLQKSTWKWVENEELLDVALVILAVYSYQPAAISGACLAQLANKMLKSEVKTGGPYYNNNQYVDTTTNLAVSRLFQTLGAPLPNVDSFLKDKGADPSMVYGVLLKWPGFVFSKNEIKKLERDMPYFAHALLYNKLPQPDSYAEETHDVTRLVQEQIESMDAPLKTSLIDICNTVSEADASGEIKMLSSYFASSLLNRPQDIDRSLCVTLGAANVFTWMAYTIYDDFIDDDGRTDLLPAANVSLQQALKIYSEVCHTPGLRQQVFEYFSKMDTANSWEVAHCRFELEGEKIVIKELPNYGNFIVLANRARGHVLGPLVVINNLEMTNNQRLNIEKGFEQYLIAKQLSDDLQDWQEDLGKGHISAVVAWLLNEIKTSSGRHSVPKLVQVIQENLWTGSLVKINQMIVNHVSLSEDYFKKSKLINLNGELFTKILNPLKETVLAAEKNNLYEKEFLDVYLEKAKD